MLPCDTGVATMSSPSGKENAGVQLHLKELELEMCHLAVKEKELDYELQSLKIEVDRQLCLKELEMKERSSPPRHPWCLSHMNLILTSVFV